MNKSMVYGLIKNGVFMALVVTGFIFVMNAINNKELPVYPDYTELIDSVLTKIEDKVDILSSNIKAIELDLIDNKVKEHIIIERLKTIKVAKDEEITSIDTFSDASRDSARINSSIFDR